LRDRQRSEDKKNLFEVKKMTDDIEEYPEKRMSQTTEYQENVSTTDLEESEI
jgi:hypothetical protein